MLHYNFKNIPIEWTLLVNKADCLSFNTDPATSHMKFTTFRVSKNPSGSFSCLLFFETEQGMNQFIPAFYAKRSWLGTVSDLFCCSARTGFLGGALPTFQIKNIDANAVKSIIDTLNEVVPFSSSQRNELSAFIRLPIMEQHKTSRFELGMRS